MAAILVAFVYKKKYALNKKKRNCLGRVLTCLVAKGILTHIDPSLLVACPLSYRCRSVLHVIFTCRNILFIIRATTAHVTFWVYKKTCNIGMR